MKTRVATVGIGIAVVLATALPSRSQQPEVKPSAAAKKAALEQMERATWSEHTLSRKRAEIELAILEAQVEAKRAEIKRIDAERRMRELAPTLAILTKLERPIAIHFPNETPLEDVLKFLKAATSSGPGDGGLPIYVDPVGLQEADKTLASTVTLDLEGIPVKTTLRLVLKQVGLAYEVKDGLVTISSPDSFEAEAPEGRREGSEKVEGRGR